MTWLAVLVVTVVTVGGVVLFSRSRAFTEANDRRTALGRADLHLQQLQSALIEQQSGLRGYLLTGDRDSLEPFWVARIAWPTIYRSVMDDTSLSSSPAALPTVTRVGARYQAWTDKIVLPLLARDRRNPLSHARPASAVAQDQRVVGSVIKDLDGLQRQIKTSRDQALGSEKSRLAAVWYASAGLGVASILVVILVAWVTRRFVVSPLSQLGVAARQVAEGHLETPVDQPHLQEMAGLARDVNAMRVGLISQIQERDSLLAGLRQQSPSVAQLSAMLKVVLPAEFHQLRVTGRCTPAEGVLSGDWSTVVSRDDGNILIVLGDVAGHGTASAVTALAAQQRIVGALMAGLSPSAALKAANPLFEQADECFESPALASVFAAVVDSHRHSMCFASAGHPTALMWQPGVTTPLHLESTGPVLCSIAGTDSWHDEKVAFPHGATFALFSDGLIEARSPHSGHDYGEERLALLLGAHLTASRASWGDSGKNSGDQLVSIVYEDVMAHAGTLTDDGSLILAQH